MPFLVDSNEQGWEFYDNSPWQQVDFVKFPAMGFRALSAWKAGFGSFPTTFPLNTPADAAGKKMRVLRNGMMRWTMEKLEKTAKLALLARGIPVNGCPNRTARPAWRLSDPRPERRAGSWRLRQANGLNARGAGPKREFRRCGRQSRLS
ncbi:MAG: hypothetical protein C0524_06300 [Rhodobacter sp.]|nr:hypothetical protein [Rhodobacter sp.]